MSFLPSPIPHPLAWWHDAPGWVLEGLNWVVGVQWPEGNEKLTWDLSDAWYGAGTDLAPAIEAFTQGGPDASMGFGGLYSDIGAQIDAIWRAYANDPETGLRYLQTVLHDIGQLVDGTACDIESAKIEMYVEIGFLIAELIMLAAAAFATFGTTAAAEPAAMAAGRFAISRIFKQLLRKVAERAAKKASKEAIEAAAKKVSKDGLRRLLKGAGKHALREGAEEVATEFAIESSQLARGRRDGGFDLLALGFSAVGGGVGGALGGVAGLGPSIKNKYGHFFESLTRGAAGEMIAETGASLATGQGLPSLTNIGMAGTSGMRSGLTDHVTEGLNDRTRDRLADIDAHIDTTAAAVAAPSDALASLALPTRDPDLTGPPTTTGTAATTGAGDGSADVHSGESVQTVSSGQSGYVTTVSTPVGGGTTDLAGLATGTTSPAAAVTGVATVPASTPTGSPDPDGVTGSGTVAVTPTSLAPTGPGGDRPMGLAPPAREVAPTTTPSAPAPTAAPAAGPATAAARPGTTAAEPGTTAAGPAPAAASPPGTPVARRPTGTSLPAGPPQSTAVPTVPAGPHATVVVPGVPRPPVGAVPPGTAHPGPQQAHQRPAEPSHWARRHEGLGGLRLAQGSDAVQAMHDAVRRTNSGYDFSGDPLMGRHAAALGTEPDVVKIAVIGRPNGEFVVGNVRMSAADFAGGLKQLGDDGVIDLGAGSLKLVACHAGAGADPPAAVLARELGRKVAGATDLVWTDQAHGAESVASLDPRTGLPTHPPDGAWRTFAADGSEISVEPSTGRKYPLVLRVGTDGLLHAGGDPFGTYRSQDGLLHKPGDRAHTWRDVPTLRLHHDLDGPGTYRTEARFKLVSAGHRGADPLAAGPVVHHAAQGPRERAYPSQPPSQVTTAAQRAAAARDAVLTFRTTQLEPLLSELGVTGHDPLSRANLPDTLHRLRASSANDPARLARVDRLEQAAGEHRRLQRAARDAVAEVPRAAARHLLMDRYAIVGDDVVADGTGRRGSPDFSVAGFARAAAGRMHRLVVLETADPRRTGYTLQNGTRTERGTPAYLRDVLQTSQALHEHLRRHPDLLDGLHLALARGELTVEYRRVEVEIDQPHNVTVWTRELSIAGLDLQGVAESLPPPTGRPDPLLSDRLHRATREIGAALDRPGERHGVGHVSVLTDDTLQIHPARGKPYRLTIGAGDGGRPFTVTLDPDGGPHRIEISHRVADGLDQAGLARLLARAVGHANGEVAAASSGRLSRFFGGRLGGRNALVLDPTPGRHEPLSYRDLAHLGEFEALARLHRVGAQQQAVAGELRRFIEEHALREGLPGAEQRAALAAARLSTAAQQLMAEQRVWWRDSDPVVAGVRTLLGERTFAGAKIEPVPALGKTVYQVNPEGWRKLVRAPFTVEIRSGDVAGAAVAEFRGTPELRHFELVVDPSVDLRGPGRVQFEEALKGIFAEKIRQQAARPAELPWRRRDRLASIAPGATSIGGMLGVAYALSSELLTTKGVASSIVDIITANRLNRAITIDRINNEHNRRIAQLPEHRDGRSLQDGIESGFDTLEVLAASLLGDASVVHRTVQPARAVRPDQSPVPDDDARTVRRLAGQSIADINRKLSQQPIEHLRKVRKLRDDRYRLVIPGMSNDAVVRVMAAHTANTQAIEVRFTRREVELRVPPELVPTPFDQAAHDALARVVRKALTEVAQRQYAISQRVAGLPAQLEKGATAELQQDVPMYPAAEALAHNLGKVILPAGAARAVVQAVIDRYLDRRARDLEDLRERFDRAESTRLDDDQRRQAANQLVDLARDGADVAQRLLDALTGTHTAPPSPATPSRSALSAVTEAMVEVSRARDAPFELKGWQHDGKDQWLVFKSDQPGIKYDAEIRLTFRDGGDGRPVVPAAEWIRRGRFEFVVDTNADPDAIRKAIKHIAENIMYDREHKVPLRRRAYEVLMPAGVRGATSTAVGLVTAVSAGVKVAVGAGFLAGVGAVAHVANYFIDRFHNLRLHDMQLNSALFNTHHEDVPPESLRERVAELGEPVRALETHVREVEAQLAQDPRTGTQVDQLRQALGEIPRSADELLAGLAGRLTDLPRRASLSTVLGADHTYRVQFKGAHGRPEAFTFELRSGHTDGTALAAHRVNSDITFALRVDPTRPPQEIDRAVHEWVRAEIERAATQPSGLPSGRARALVAAQETAAQTAASAASVSLIPLASAAGIHLPGKPPTWDDVAVQGTWAGNAGAAATATQVSNTSREAHEAVSDATRNEQLLRHFLTASEEHLGVFSADIHHLLDRTWQAHERLGYLGEIASQLPPNERPLLPHSVPALADPVAWGEAPEVVTVEPDAVLRFAGQALERPSGELVAEAAQIGSTRPGTVHWIIDGATLERVGLVRLLGADSWLFEGVARDVLGQQPWQRLTVPEAVAVGVARDARSITAVTEPGAIDDGTVVLVDRAPAGRGLDELIHDVRDGDPRGRSAATRRLASAIGDIAGALAELHHGPADPGTVQRAPYLARYAAALAMTHEWADDPAIRQRWSLEPDLAGRFAGLYRAMLEDPGRGSLVHGTLEPGKLFHHATHGRVTMLDVGALSDWVDIDDHPVGVAAADVARFLHTLTASLRTAGLTEAVPNLLGRFLDAYRAAAAAQESGQPLSPSAVAFFRAMELSADIHAAYVRIKAENLLSQRPGTEPIEARAIMNVRELGLVLHGLDPLLDPVLPEPVYENPGHHDPNGGASPYNPAKAVLPPDAADQFAHAVEVDGVRWAKVAAGRSTVYYRYFNHGNNHWHWSGSTVGVTAGGVPVPIPEHQVPIEVRRQG